MLRIFRHIHRKKESFPEDPLVVYISAEELQEYAEMYLGRPLTDQELALAPDAIIDSLGIEGPKQDIIRVIANYATRQE